MTVRVAILGVVRSQLSPVESGPDISRDISEVDRAFADVLVWVTAAPATPVTFAGLTGVTDQQSAYLARVAALVLSKIGSDTSASVLWTPLAAGQGIDVPASVMFSLDTVLGSDPIALLAKLYASVVRSSNRRALGTFFTPSPEAASMVQQFAVHHPAPGSVVDIGAGVGVFSAAAIRRWPEADVLAIDINPLTLGLQAVALAAIGEHSIELVLRDFGTWLASYEPAKPTLYLGNPPYTRWQLIPDDDRKRLLDTTDGLVGSRANLSTIFLAMALRKLRPQDALSLIVPAGWMNAGYARHLRSYVRGLHRRPITLRFADSWRFESAIVDAVVVEVGPETGTKTQPLLVEDWPGTVCVELSRESSDTSPFAGLDMRPEIPADETGAKFGDFVRFTRGIATGANGFFVRSSTDVLKTGVHGRWWTPVIRRLKASGDRSKPDVEAAFLLNLKEYEAGTDHAVDELISGAVQRNIDKGHLCSVRERWFDLSGEIRVPDVILTSLGRDVFHVRENFEGHTITNNLFGWTWRDHVTLDERMQLLGWVRSDEGQMALLRSAVSEANGLRRLSPRSLGAIGLPPEALGRDTASLI